jgi:hypothetical protein
MMEYVVPLLIMLSAAILAIIIMLRYVRKQDRIDQELHSQDGLVSEKKYYLISMGIWFPIYAIIAFIVLRYHADWVDSLGNLFVFVNVTILIFPAFLIRRYLVYRNRDKVRPPAPMAKGARIINYIILALFIFWVIWEIRTFILVH